MTKKQTYHDISNHIFKLKTILELIQDDDLPMPKDQILQEIEISLQKIKDLYTKLLF